MKKILFVAVAVAGLMFVFGGNTARAGHFGGHKSIYYPYPSTYYYPTCTTPIYTFPQPVVVYPHGHHFHVMKYPVNPYPHFHVHNHHHKPGLMY